MAKDGEGVVKKKLKIENEKKEEEEEMEIEKPEDFLKDDVKESMSNDESHETMSGGGQSGQTKTETGEPGETGEEEKAEDVDVAENSGERKKAKKKRRMSGWFVLDRKLQRMGLEIRNVRGDGNCLFRALCDQLDGRCVGHFYLRCKVANFIQKHQEDYAPILEENETFTEHVKDLKKDGEHAGNDAIVAFSKLHSVTVVVHQPYVDPLYFYPSEDAKYSRQVHIGFHAMHYISIRKNYDNSEYPAFIYIPDPNAAPGEIVNDNNDNDNGNPLAGLNRRLWGLDVFSSQGWHGIEDSPIKRKDIPPELRDPSRDKLSYFLKVPSLHFQLDRVPIHSVRFVLLRGTMEISVHNDPGNHLNIRRKSMKDSGTFIIKGGQLFSLANLVPSPAYLYVTVYLN